MKIVLEVATDIQTPKQITEIALFCIFLLLQRTSILLRIHSLICYIDIKYDQISNTDSIGGLINYLEKSQVPREIQDLTIQILSCFCKDEDIYRSLLENFGFEKFGIKPKDQTANPDVAIFNTSAFNYPKPLAYYEGSNVTLLQTGLESGSGNNMFVKRPPRISTPNMMMSNELAKNSSKDPNSKGIYTPEVRSNRHDIAGRRYSSKDKGALPSNHAVNRTIDTASLQSAANIRTSNKKLSAKDDSFEILKDKGENLKNRSKKVASANFQLPTLNSASGRPLFKNQ